MPNYGVIDLGSNTIRMVIYDVPKDHLTHYSSKHFKSIINDKIMAGLSAFVEDGIFTEAGIERATAVLKGHAKRAQYFNCARLEVFATAVIRNAKNSEEARVEIERRTNLPITLLSSQEEAHLGFVGARCSCPMESGTLIDIGGGSTELTHIVDNEDFFNVSMGQGSLSSFARHVKGIIPTSAEMDAIRAELRTHLMNLSTPEIYQNSEFFGVGGSIRAAAKVIQQINGLSSRPKTVTNSDIREILNRCQTNPDWFAHAALKASAERIHTLIPGCIILDTLFDEFGGENITVCKHGVREGYLVERLLHASSCQ